MTSETTVKQTSPFSAALSVSAALFAFSIGMGVLPAALVKIRPELGLSLEQMSQLSLCAFVPIVIAVLAAAKMSEFQPKGTVMAAGAALAVVGCLILSFCSGFNQLAIGLIVLGFGAGMIESTGSALIGEQFSGPARTAALNFSHVAFAAGCIGIPLIMAALIKADLDWRIGFMISAGVFALAGLWAMFSGTNRLGLTVVSHHTHWKADIFGLTLIVTMFFYVGAEVGVSYWLPAYFQKVLNSPDAFAAATNGIFWSGIVIGRIVAAMLAARVATIVMLRWSSGASLACLAVFYTISDPIPALVVVFLSGLSLACIWPVIVSYAGEVYHQRLSRVMPWIIAAGAFGASAGPASVGTLASETGLRTAYLLNALAAAIMLAVFAFVRKLEKHASVNYNVEESDAKVRL